MAGIFTPWKLKDLTIPNRLVRSATWEGLAEADGTPTYELVNVLAALAEGGVGLIITGFAFISPEGKALPKQTGAHIDAMIGPLTRISDAVHKCGGLVALQIAHAGGQTKQEWTGHRPVGPSAIQHPAFGPVQELSKDQIADIIEAFALAAGRGKAAGFDAVELHAAHGYLANQFLSPFCNQRQDEYGGDWQGRGRFVFEMCRAARDLVGPHYPVFIKLNTADYVDNGLELSDALKVAQRLSDMGLDAIEVSGGQPAAGKLGSARKVKEPDQEGYFLDNAVAVKQVVACPVISVGGWRSRAQVEKALEHVDAVSMSRPFIRQPDLAKRWQAGETQAACISCNGCFKVNMTQGLGCAQELKEQAKEGQ
ncbi:MAG: NADH:flavin oxidoreductase [Desulfarculus sp.]|nr:MAG: NADH:flavin oxidoreductase [Desulfarculus sp.]